MKLIDADALMDDICEDLNQMTNIGITVDGEWLWGKLNDALDNAPTVQPQKRRGKWILHIDDLFPLESTMECNQCHEHQPVTIDDNFCPNCGADMRGGQNETNRR